MIRSRITPFVALATMLVACSDVPTTTEVKVSKQADECSDCYDQTLSLAPSSEIHLGGTPVIAFVVTGGALSVSALKPGTTVSVISDTIPSPAPPGPALSDYARFGAGPFKAILNSLANAGLVAPSDTIPAPGPPAPGVAASIQGFSTGVTVVWLSTSYLQKKGLSTSTTSLTLQVSTRGTTVYNATVPVTVFAK